MVKTTFYIRQFKKRLVELFSSNVYFGKHPDGLPPRCIIFFPYSANMLSCGLTGMVTFKNKKKMDKDVNLISLGKMVDEIEAHPLKVCLKNNLNFQQHYLCGEKHINDLFRDVRRLKTDDLFYNLFIRFESINDLLKLAGRLSKIIDSETNLFAEYMGRIGSDDVEVLARRLDSLKDIGWCLDKEIAGNLKKVADLLKDSDKGRKASVITVLKKINSVLNSIDRLEVRGRDSAGISLLFFIEEEEFNKFRTTLSGKGLLDHLTKRLDSEALTNRGVSINNVEDDNGDKLVSMAVTYKIAAEIGSLGDNVRFLRDQIKNDDILAELITFPVRYHTVCTHTRWASVGAISEFNCHPVDNQITQNTPPRRGIIHACLNGDIDNYRKLKKDFENDGIFINKDITTDTKIIPLQIEKYIRKGCKVEEAFRLAVNDFEGSHAISMHTDLAPGKIFLAQKGSGQAIFVGISEDCYVPTSEVYGLIEETFSFIKMDGEKQVEGKKGMTGGQIFILNQNSAGGVAGIKAMYYDRTPVELKKEDIKQTDITSRDIDRQNFPHYFLKEISESPDSVEKTLQNRWKIIDDDPDRFAITLDEKTFPVKLKKAFMDKKIRRVFFVGQGTAGVAALACANILQYYMDDPLLYINALKASELSGFQISEDDDQTSMSDALVIAISQSGTTTDTNRTVDMVKERGAHTLAIVNRRDSDITFKVDGVMYTSSGRDIEMSVASTKAFYSQIVAGAALSLYIARLRGRRDGNFETSEIKDMIRLPRHMRKVLAMGHGIEKSAKRLATGKIYWAAVGSGPNKASADEIRIKLSELCYKTISSDYIEDKKHIDLSSEPLIIVCAAGTRNTVIGDIIKDTAIFQAHKASPVVIANEGENRFDPYAEDVFHVPIVSEHFAPILNTLVGHIWGYYAALAINEGSRFLYDFRKDVQDAIDENTASGLNVYELILEKSFREKIVAFYQKFRRKKIKKDFPSAIGLEAVADLTLLLKYLSGRLPISDFELDFGEKGTALNMLNRLFRCLGESINCMSRPVDAIRHQAKTVTVGTSRISEKMEGLLFETLAEYNISLSQLINKNIIVLKNLQEIVAEIKGGILYRIKDLNLLGEPTDRTKIEIIRKEGVLQPIASRVETDNRLKGTKRIIVREGNVYIGIGRKDDRSIIVIPVISASDDTPNMIEYILLLTITFKTDVPLSSKIKALGGKYERIKNIVQENSVQWDDQYIELVEMRQLFGISAEKTGEFIVSCVDSSGSKV